MRTAIELISATADLLEDGEEGPVWCQGVYTMEIDGRDHYCIVGAFDHTARVDYSNHNDVYLQAKDLIRDAIRDNSIIGWNDAPERTAAEVIALLRGIVHDSESDTTERRETA